MGRDFNMNIEHQVVQHFERCFHCQTYTNACTQRDTNMHKDVCLSPTFTRQHTAVLPRSQSAGPDSPCWCSSAVINSLTLCVKNLSPTHSFPAPFSPPLFPALLLSCVQSLASCFDPVPSLPPVLLSGFFFVFVVLF